MSTFDDPIQDIIDWFTVLARKIALTLMDEIVTISPGESMTIPNKIEPLRIYYERLESEPDPRSLAQKARRSKERGVKQLVDGSVRLYASLFASHSISK